MPTDEKDVDETSVAGAGLPTATSTAAVISPTPLTGFDEIRPRVLDEVCRRTTVEVGSTPLDLLLGETLYSERLRLKRDRPNIFTKSRSKQDRRVLNHLQTGLLQPAAMSDRRALLEEATRHFAEEIGGHFDPKVYRFATHAVPFVFSWLLNAASDQAHLAVGDDGVGRVAPADRGRDPAWLQKLATKGTILLVPTHQSNIDSILIGYMIYLMGLPPFAYGAGLNLFSNPRAELLHEQPGRVYGGSQENNEIYKAALKNYSTVILREGVHSIFFPGRGALAQRARSRASSSSGFSAPRSTRRSRTCARASPNPQRVRRPDGDELSLRARGELADRGLSDGSGQGPLHHHGRRVLAGAQGAAAFSGRSFPTAPASPRASDARWMFSAISSTRRAARSVRTARRSIPASCSPRAASSGPSRSAITSTRASWASGSSSAFTGKTRC